MILHYLRWTGLCLLTVLFVENTVRYSAGKSVFSRDLVRQRTRAPRSGESRARMYAHSEFSSPSLKSKSLMTHYKFQPTFDRFWQHYQGISTVLFDSALQQ